MAWLHPLATVSEQATAIFLQDSCGTSSVQRADPSAGLAAEGPLQTEEETQIGPFYGCASELPVSGPSPRRPGAPPVSSVLLESVQSVPAVRLFKVALDLCGGALPFPPSRATLP